MEKILVIDDDDQFRDMFRRMLEIAGYDVLTAANGKIGAKLYKESGADLIITDILMRERGGLETILNIKANYPNAKIFAVSGGGLVAKVDYLRIAKSIGAIETFRKPFERTEMLTAIENAMH